MASQELLAAIEQVQQLTPDEQRVLIAEISERLAAVGHPVVRRRRWSEIRGAAPYPLTGEDAQDWVTRNRQEDDEHRRSLLPPEYRS